jgi:glycine/D-amino acid oxidase-like deaminating enzyme
MGSRNETNPSLWVGTTPDAPHFHELHSDIDTEVVVVGAGIAGLTAAALLKADGRRVVVVEAGRVAAGVTGYTTAKLTVLHGLIFDDLISAFGEEGAGKYANANLAGMATVADLAVRQGFECDLERGRAYTNTTDRAMV